MQSNESIRLLIVTHVVHFQMPGGVYSFAPYTREVNVWARLFPHVTIAAPLRNGNPTGFSERLSGNVRMLPQPEVGGSGPIAKLKLLLAVPGITLGLIRAMRKADAVHVRCPGNLGLLGALLAPLFAKNMAAKYAGQWSPYPGEAKSVRFQRWLLGSRWWRGPVTVFGKRPGEREHVIPFFNSMLTKELEQRAAVAAAGRTARDGRPLRIVFVGRLSRGKNVVAVIRALARHVSGGASARLTVVGEGPEEQPLRDLARSLGVDDLVSFTGGLPFEGVLDELEKADVLTLVSRTEGFPKAIAEAMAFGLVCIGSNRGLIPKMLSEGRGFVVEPEDVDALAAAMTRIDSEPELALEMSRRSALWGSEYSQEALERALAELLREHWGVDCRAIPELGAGEPAATV